MNTQLNTQLKTPLLRGNGFGREVVKLKRIAFKVPTERASKTRSPLRVEFSTGYSTEYSTGIQLVFNWQLSFQLASANGFRPGLACRPASRPREHPAGRPGMSCGPVGWQTWDDSGPRHFFGGTCHLHHHARQDKARLQTGTTARLAGQTAQHAATLGGSSLLEVLALRVPQRYTAPLHRLDQRSQDGCRDTLDGPLHAGYELAPGLPL